MIALLWEWLLASLPKWERRQRPDPHWNRRRCGF